MSVLNEELRKREILAVKMLGEQIGYGNIMDIASALWAMKLSDDEHTRIMHVPTVEPFMKKKEWRRTEQEVLGRIEEIKSYGICFDDGFMNIPDNIGDEGLPCKVGYTVYAICTCEAVRYVLDGTLYDSNGGYGTATGYYCPYELNEKCPHIEADDCAECKNIESVFEDTVDYINITEYEVLIGLKNTNLCVTADAIGKTVFLTQSEAEEALRKMKESEE